MTATIVGLDDFMARAVVKRSPKKSPYFTTAASSRVKREHSERAVISCAEGIEAVEVKQTVVTKAKQRKVKSPSCVPFAPTGASEFGLVQEKLAHDPFRLLIATIFLNKTRGKVAIPVLYQLFGKYPTPADLASANTSDIAEMMQCLGLQNTRAKKCVELSRKWLETPPTKGVRYRRLHYPKHKDGSDIKPRETVDEDDSRIAWEAAHLPGIGPYALDSWRIFCRDEMRGLAKDWKGTGASNSDFVPEWKTVLPQDKELRAFLAWMWLKEGYEWNCLNGELKPVRKKILRAIEKDRSLYLNHKGRLKVIKR